MKEVRAKREFCNRFEVSNDVSVVCSVVPFDSISVPVKRPILVSVTAQSSTSVTAVWELPQRYTNDKDILSFKLLYRSLVSDTANNTTVEKASTTVVTGLEKFTEYEFKVCVFSSVGCGPKSSSKIARTLEDGKGL